MSPPTKTPSFRPERSEVEKSALLPSRQPTSVEGQQITLIPSSSSPPKPSPAPIQPRAAAMPRQYRRTPPATSEPTVRHHPPHPHGRGSSPHTLALFKRHLKPNHRPIEKTNGDPVIHEQKYKAFKALHERTGHSSSQIHGTPAPRTFSPR